MFFTSHFFIVNRKESRGNYKIGKTYYSFTKSRIIFKTLY